VSAGGSGVTANELLAVMGARELKDNMTVFAGVGAPLMASALAQRTHAPGLTMMVEGGIIGPTPSSWPSGGFSTWASSGAPRSTVTAT
jgi:acyl CoA:acetate/3-ketoacid CoA transferase beta subunit